MSKYGSVGEIIDTVNTKPHNSKNEPSGVFLFVVLRERYANEEHGDQECEISEYGGKWFEQ